jgi:hypothetical protein
VADKLPSSKAVNSKVGGILTGQRLEGEDKGEGDS